MQWAQSRVQNKLSLLNHLLYLALFTLCLCLSLIALGAVWRAWWLCSEHGGCRFWSAVAAALQGLSENVIIFRIVCAVVSMYMSCGLAGTTAPTFAAMFDKNNTQKSDAIELGLLAKYKSGGTAAECSSILKDVDDRTAEDFENTTHVPDDGFVAKICNEVAEWKIGVIGHDWQTEPPATEKLHGDGLEDEAEYDLQESSELSTEVKALKTQLVQSNCLVHELQAQLDSLYDPTEDPAHEDTWLVRCGAIIEYSAQVMFAVFLASFYEELDQLQIASA